MATPQAVVTKSWGEMAKTSPVGIVGSGGGGGGASAVPVTNTGTGYLQGYSPVYDNGKLLGFEKGAEFIPKEAATTASGLYEPWNVKQGATREVPRVGGGTSTVSESQTPQGILQTIQTGGNIQYRIMQNAQEVGLYKASLTPQTQLTTQQAQALYPAMEQAKVQQTYNLSPFLQMQPREPTRGTDLYAQSTRQYSPWETKVTDIAGQPMTYSYADTKSFEDVFGSLKKQGVLGVTVFSIGKAALPITPKEGVSKETTYHEAGHVLTRLAFGKDEKTMPEKQKAALFKEGGEALIRYRQANYQDTEYIPEGLAIAKSGLLQGGKAEAYVRKLMPETVKYIEQKEGVLDNSKYINKLVGKTTNQVTMAVEKGTGRIAGEYGLNTNTAQLEDHIFIKDSAGNWIDTSKQIGESALAKAYNPLSVSINVPPINAPKKETIQYIPEFKGKLPEGIRQTVEGREIMYPFGGGEPYVIPKLGEISKVASKFTPPSWVSNPFERYYYEKGRVVEAVSKNKPLATAAGFGSATLLLPVEATAQLITHPIKTVTSTIMLPKSIATGELSEQVAQMFQRYPEYSLGYMLGLGVTAGKGYYEKMEVIPKVNVFSSMVKSIGLEATKLSPKYSPVETTVLGERIIKGVEVLPGQRIDIGLIPERGAKLDIQPAKFLKEFGTVEPMPKLPKLTAQQENLLGAVKKEGGIVGGSFAQKVMYGEKARAFEDIDVIVKNPKEFTKSLNLPKSFEITEVTKGKTAGIVKVSGEGLKADIVPPSMYKEHRFLGVGKIKTTDAFGLNLVSPEILLKNKADILKETYFNVAEEDAKSTTRLKAEYAAEQKLKFNKATKDIKTLTGKDIGLDLNKATLTGPYGFTKAEQAAYIGKTGTVTTSARSLFKFMEREVKVKEKKGYGLFATPFDIKTGMAQTRVTRLGIEEPIPATWKDVISGNVALRKGKPQIVAFPDETIGKNFKLPYKSSELEVTLAPRRVPIGYKVGSTIINKRKVDIISGKVMPEGYKGAIGKVAGFKKSLLGFLTEKRAVKDRGFGYSPIKYSSGKPYFSPYNLLKPVKTPMALVKASESKRISIIPTVKISSKAYMPTKISYPETTPNYVSKSITSIRKYPSERQVSKGSSFGISSTIERRVTPSYTTPSINRPSYTTPAPIRYPSPKRVSYPSPPRTPERTNYPRPYYPSPPKTPERNRQEFFKQPTRKPMQTQTGFIPEIRRFGKFKQILGIPTTFERALAIGKQKAGETLGASIRIKSPKGYVNLQPSGMFRLGKMGKEPFTLVQKSRTRLSNPLEVSAIISSRRGGFRL